MSASLCFGPRPFNLVYNTDWSDERKLRKEISGAHSRLRDTLEEMERWLEPS